MHKFGVWAPNAQKMSLKLGDRVLPMNAPNKRGWWMLAVAETGCGDDYAFLIDDDPTKFRKSGLIGFEIEGTGKIFMRNIWLKKL